LRTSLPISLELHLLDSQTAHRLVICSEGIKARKWICLILGVDPPTSIIPLRPRPRICQIPQAKRLLLLRLRNHERDIHRQTCNYPPVLRY
ncbi:hypothetical protein KCU81_g420, partial [Aureobasidium melanogenum]